MKKTEFIKKERMYILSNGASPLSMYIPHKDTKRSRLLYSDPNDNGEQKILRYSRNHPSPFLKDQDETAIVEAIVFKEGIKIVPSVEVSLQKFLAIHPGNEANGGSLFYEHDPEAEAIQRMEELDLRTDAIIAVKGLDLNKTLSLARIFLKGNIDKMSTSEIKYDLTRYAESHPSEFLDALDDPDADLNNYAARALQDNLVTFRAGKDLYYNLPDNKKKILTVAHGLKPQQALASWLISDDGLDFYKVLSNMYED